MPKNKIYVIHSNSKIESLYTLFPLIVSEYSHLVCFLNLESDEAKRAEGDCAILVRTFKGNPAFEGQDERKREFIKDIKKRFNRVVMLDDGAGSDSLRYEYMDLVDLYYKGKLLKDRNAYLKPMYGRQIFTNYYKEKFGITDEKVKLREAPNDPSVLEKLRISWNLGCGIYPVPHIHLVRLARAATNYNIAKILRPWYVYSYRKMVKRMSEPINFAAKLKVVHARFGSNSLPNTVGYQRKIFMQQCKENKNVLAGSVKPGAYNTEIKQAGAVLSPFGWGEICFRDFEAIINNCLLIKPNMDHIETWPNVYKSAKTYLPVNWDGTDLIAAIDEVSNHITDYTPVIEAAREEYKNSLLQIDNKVLDFLAEVSGVQVN